MPDVVLQVDLPDVPKIRSGKVREVFDLGDRYLFVATDRISAFDCVLPNGIPNKGQVLNLISAWWFRRLEHIVPHHCLSVRVADLPVRLQEYRGVLRGRAMLVRKARVLPIECIVRGYLIGSGWKDYQATGSVCGIRLRPGYRLADQLDEPLFTPSTKAETGHDVNISFDEVVRIVGGELAERLRSTSLALYRAAASYALERGIIIADTKFEFGLMDDNQLCWVDEALTPDSSRFWPASEYRPGSNPPSFDKQYVRDYLEQLSWNKQPPAPPLPPDVVRRTQEKYLEAFERLTGMSLDQALAET